MSEITRREWTRLIERIDVMEDRLNNAHGRINIISLTGGRITALEKRADKSDDFEKWRSANHAGDLSDPESPQPGTLACVVAEAKAAGMERVENDGWWQDMNDQVWDEWEQGGEWKFNGTHLTRVDRFSVVCHKVKPALTRRQARDAALDILGEDFEFVRVFYANFGEGPWVVGVWTNDDYCKDGRPCTHTVDVDPITGIATEQT